MNRTTDNYLHKRNVEEKRRFKMYKDGKRWVFMAVAIATLGIASAPKVQANDTFTDASTTISSSTIRPNSDSYNGKQNHSNKNFSDVQDGELTSNSRSSKLNDIAVNKTVVDKYTEIEKNTDDQRKWINKTNHDSFDVKETVRHNTNYEISITPPEYVENPLYSNTVFNKSDSEYYTYSYENGGASTSSYGIIDNSNGLEKIYDFEDTFNNSYDTSKQDGMDLVRNTFTLPYFNKYNLGIKETLFLTNNGIIVHHTKFTNNNNFTLPKNRYYVLLDTMLNNNDEINIYYDGLGGAYFKNNKVYFSTKMLSSGNMYALNWRNRDRKIGTLLNSYKLKAGERSTIDVDSAIRYVTNEVALEPGKSLSLWYMEAVLSNREIKDITKNGDIFDIGLEVQKFLQETVSADLVKKNSNDVYNRAEDNTIDIDELNHEYLMNNLGFDLSGDDKEDVQDVTSKLKDYSKDGKELAENTFNDLEEILKSKDKIDKANKVKNISDSNLPVIKYLSAVNTLISALTSVSTSGIHSFKDAVSLASDLINIFIDFSESVNRGIISSVKTTSSFVDTINDLGDFNEAIVNQKNVEEKNNKYISSNVKDRKKAFKAERKAQLDSNKNFIKLVKDGLSTAVSLVGNANPVAKAAAATIGFLLSIIPAAYLAYKMIGVTATGDKALLEKFNLKKKK